MEYLSNTSIRTEFNYVTSSSWYIDLIYKVMINTIFWVNSTNNLPIKFNNYMRIKYISGEYGSVIEWNLIPSGLKGESFSVAWGSVWVNNDNRGDVLSDYVNIGWGYEGSDLIISWLWSWLECQLSLSWFDKFNNSDPCWGSTISTTDFDLGIITIVLNVNCNFMTVDWIISWSEFS